MTAAAGSNRVNQVHWPNGCSWIRDRGIFGVILSMIAACSPVARTRATIAVSAALLACDWSQTRSRAERGWDGKHETNPIMGETPAPHAVDGYFVATAAAFALATVALPARWRWMPAAGLGGVEADAVRHNLWTVDGVCGR